MARTDVRSRMIKGAADLLSTRGLAGTSFAEVLALTGAPRGSVYHHFPGGKTELVQEALRYVGDGVVGALDRRDGLPADEVVAAFAAMWRRVLVGSDGRGGCAVAAVTIGAEPGELVEAAADVFRAWRHTLARLLAAGGVGVERATVLASTVLAGLEGAMLLARADGDVALFDVVADELIAVARAEAGEGRSTDPAGRGVSRRRGRS